MLADYMAVIFVQSMGTQQVKD